MKFLYEDYYRAAFVIPIIILVVVLFIIIENILVFVKVIRLKNQFKIANVFLSVIVTTVFILISAFSLSRSCNLPKDKGSDSITIQSIVQNVTNMPFAEKYNVDGKASYAKYIELDGVKYYCMNADNIQTGTLIEIEYLPESKFILKIDIIEE